MSPTCLLLCSGQPAGGTGRSVANSVGGSLPCDALLEANRETPEQIATRPHPFYTPIATFGSDYRLEPVAYGLKFAGSFSGGILFETEFSKKEQVAPLAADVFSSPLVAAGPCPQGRLSTGKVDVAGLCRHPGKKDGDDHPFDASNEVDLGLGMLAGWGYRPRAAADGAPYLRSEFGATPIAAYLQTTIAF